MERYIELDLHATTCTLAQIRNSTAANNTETVIIRLFNPYGSRQSLQPGRMRLKGDDIRPL